MISFLSRFIACQIILILSLVMANGVIDLLLAFSDLNVWELAPAFLFLLAYEVQTEYNFSLFLWIVYGNEYLTWYKTESTSCEFLSYKPKA